MKYKFKLFLVLSFVLALIVSFRFLPIQEYLRNSLDWINGLGAFAPLIFSLIYILACIFFVPGAILTLGAGVIFGVIKGSIIVSIASTLGATCAFLVGRYFARGWVARKVETNSKFKQIDEAVGREGWKIVGLTRLSPIFPFNMLNYAFGLTRVSLRDYFFTSWVGMIPGTVMYVYIGSLAGSLAMIGADRNGKSGLEWSFYVVGLLATIIVTFYVTHLAKKALKKEVS